MGEKIVVMNEKYVMDFSLYRVAKQLRLIGCDVACDESTRHRHVAVLAKQQKRIVITASRKFTPHLEAIQRADQQENEGDPRFTIGEYFPSTEEIHRPQRAKDTDEGQRRRPVPANKNSYECECSSSGVDNSNGGGGASAAAKAEKPKKKKRVLTGYNSEGESEYEDVSLASSTSSRCGEDEQEDVPMVVADRSEGETNTSNPNNHSQKNKQAPPQHPPGKENDESLFDDASWLEDTDDVPLRYIMVSVSDDFKRQTETVVRRMGIQWDPEKVFSRCVQCNGEISAVYNKTEIEEDVHPTVFRLYSNFYRCDGCGRVYWGMDENVLVNYKTLRTVEHAKMLCLRAHTEDDSGARSRRSKRKGKHSGTERENPQQATSTSTSTSDGTAGQDAKTEEGKVPECHRVWGNFPLGGLARASSIGLKVHLYAYPRNIKCTILAFLTPEDHEQLLKAYPVFAELVGVVQRGESWSFRNVKDKKKKKWKP